MEEEYQEQIDTIMDHFDFDEVLLVLRFLARHWWDPVLGLAPPTLARLRAAARKRLRDVASSGYMVVSSGGLRASNREGVLSLEFILCDWEGG